MEAVVFYSDAADLSGLSGRYHALRFLRLRRGWSFNSSLFINSSFKYIRSPIGVFVPEGLVPSKGDLYALANAVREGRSFAWMEPGQILWAKNRLQRALRLFWRQVSLLRRRLLQSISAPLYFDRVRFFAVNREAFGQVFGKGGFFGRRFLLRSTQSLKNSFYYNPYVNHMLVKKNAGVIELPPGRSRVRHPASPGWMSSYAHLWAILRLSRQMKNRNYALSAGRFLWPVVHLAWIFFWFFLVVSPLYSLLFLGFYSMVGYPFYSRAIHASMRHPSPSWWRLAGRALWQWVVLFLLAISV